MTNWKERIEEIQNKLEADIIESAGYDHEFEYRLACKNKSLDKLTNLITEILNSCPLKEQEGFEPTIEDLNDPDLYGKMLRHKLVTTVHNQAVAEFEKWKKEVLG